jgi:HEPN domain-containing protein/predicted nucleotidyltransferase
MTADNHDTVLEELTRVLVARFAPERVVLFGSRARGDHRPDSDYDLVVVMNHQPETRQSLYNAVREVHAAVDFILDTPERFERRRDDVGTLEYVADREGRVVYDREPKVAVRRVREDSPTEPESLREWIARAQSDFTMMSVGMANAPEARDAIVFHAHQSAEKLLKAALVARHVPPPRTHKLSELLSLLDGEFADDPTLISACCGLDELWPLSRYPEEPMPTPEQVVNATDWATHIRSTVSALFAA